MSLRGYTTHKSVVFPGNYFARVYSKCSSQKIRWCWLLLKLACVSQDHICYAEFFLNVQIIKFLSQNDIVLAISFSTISSCLDTICSVPEQLLLLMRFREEICSIQKTAIKVKKNNNYVIDNFRMKTILMNLDDENNISNNIAMIIIANKIIIIILKSFNLLNKN